MSSLRYPGLSVHVCPIQSFITANYLMYWHVCCIQKAQIWGHSPSMRKFRCSNPYLFKPYVTAKVLNVEQWLCMSWVLYIGNLIWSLKYLYLSVTILCRKIYGCFSYRLCSLLYMTAVSLKFCSIDCYCALYSFTL